MYVYIYIYIYIYTHTHTLGLGRSVGREDLEYTWLSIRMKDHHNFLRYAPLVGKTCVRQAVLDKRFPLNAWITSKWVHF